jgi:hypothetical protein
MKHLRKFNEAEFYPGFEKDDWDNSDDIEVKVTIDIPKSMINIAREFGVYDENMNDLFKSYINHLMTTIPGQEESDFTRWCEDSDNISDYTGDLNEGKTEKGYKSKDSDVKKEMFRDKIKDFLKSKDCKISQVGDDFEVHKNTEDIVIVMFRDDKMTVKKEGNKFGKNFKYNQLGDMKKELTKIIE